MYGFRIVGPILLGMGRVPAWKFLVFNFIGACIWAPLIAGLGYLFGNIIETLLEDLKNVELWAFGAVLLVGVASFLVHHIRGRRHRQAETQPTSGMRPR